MPTMKTQKEKDLRLLKFFNLIIFVPFGYGLFFVSGCLHGKYDDQWFIGGLSAPIIEELGKILIAYGVYGLLQDYLDWKWAIIISVIIAGRIQATDEFRQLLFLENDDGSLKYSFEICLQNYAVKLLFHPVFTSWVSVFFIYVKQKMISDRYYSLGYIFAVMSHSVMNGFNTNAEVNGQFEILDAYKIEFALFIMFIEIFILYYLFNDKNRLDNNGKKDTLDKWLSVLLLI